MPLFKVLKTLSISTVKGCLKFHFCKLKFEHVEIICVLNATHIFNFATAILRTKNHNRAFFCLTPCENMRILFSEVAGSRSNKEKQMEIKIVKNGHNEGTVGELAEGIEKGWYVFRESTLKCGHHCLCFDKVISGSKIWSHVIAAFDQFKLGARFAIYEPIQDFGDPQANSLPGFTQAALSTVNAIAASWCDEMNAVIDAENPIDLKIVRIEK